MPLLPRMVGFSVPKSGNRDLEWEDGAAMDPGDAHTGRPARVAIADGASAAYGARRWAAGLTAGFTSHANAPSTLGSIAMARWFGDRQTAWDQASSTPGSVLEQLKMAEGSFATFLGCVVAGLSGPVATWEAVALGDSVLFHVRGDRIEGQLPLVGPDGFGRNPDGAHTSPQALEQMTDAVVHGRGALHPRDHLFLATDALAEWIVRHRDHPPAWQFLRRVSHPDEFTRFVVGERASGAMTNDDVTLVRVFLPPAPPSHVVVCR